MVKPPIKFGSPESLAEVVGGVPSAGPKRDQSKSPGLGLVTPAAAAASVGITGNSECSAGQTNAVTPALISHAPSSTSGDAAPRDTSTRSAPSGIAVDGTTAAPESAVSSAATASSVVARGCSAAQCQAPPAKRKQVATVSSKRNIRTIRFRGGGFPAASGAVRPPPPAGAVSGVTAAAAAPLSREIQQTKAGTSNPLAAAAAAAATAATEGTTSSRESMFATATVAKRAVDNLFDTAALKLTAATPSKTVAAVAAAAKGAGGDKDKPPTAVGKGAVLPAGAARDSTPKPARAPGAVETERLLPFGPEVSDGVTPTDLFEAASSRSWVSGGGGAAEEGPRGALTGVLAAAQVLMEKVRTVL